MPFYKLSDRLPSTVRLATHSGWALIVIILLTLSLLFAEHQSAIATQRLPAQEATTATAAKLTLSQAVTTTTVIYVDQAAGGSIRDGLSWSTAFTKLQDGLAAATSGSEIWVADGIYYPDDGIGATNDDRNATFLLKQGVALYGGFAGTETARDERNWQANLAILSGDLSQNDPDKNSSGVITNPITIINPNAYHVVSAGAVDSSAVLDGFVITGGKADGTIANLCGPGCGGGLIIENSSPTLINLSILGNNSENYGGGLATINSSPSVTNVIIQANRTKTAGGGIYTRGGSPTFINTLISGNYSASRGGAIYNDRVTNPMQLINVTITGNRAVFTGGGIANSLANVIMSNSIVWNNMSNTSTDVSNSSSELRIHHSLIKNAFTGTTWNSTFGENDGNNLSSDPLFTAPLVASAAPIIGGDYTLSSLSPAADGGDLTQNPTTQALGGASRRQGATIDMGAHESPHTAQLTMTIATAPAQIEYGETVTYTIVLSNSGNAFAYAAQLTNTLPTNVSFAHWIQQPTGATAQMSSPQVTWAGDVAAGQAITYRFMVTHTGGPAETVTNTVEYGHVTSSNTTSAAFEVVALPTVSISAVNVDEADQWARFTVTLNKATRKQIVVDYATSNGTALSPADYNSRNTSLIIYPGDLDAAIFIPITGDFIDETDETFGLTLKSAINATVANGTATATILDDDTAGAAVAPTAIEVSEPSSNATFTLTLQSQPVAPVNITLSNSNTSECSLPTTIQLNAGNWRGVGINVRAIDDFVVDGDQSCLIGLTATSTDPLYDGIALATVSVTVHSDDVAGIGMTPGALTISEPAQRKSFTITLTSQPTATVTVLLTSSDPGECSAPATVNLDENNWAEGIGVEVSAIDDQIDDEDQPCLIQTQVQSSDPNYNGRAMSNLDVTVQDDDTAGVAVSPTSLTTAEPNGTKTFGISLDSEPTAPVTVAFTVSDSSECTVPPSIVLDESNWNVLVSVLVTALDDRIDDGNQLCLVQTAVTSSDAKYNEIAAADVAVTVQDDSDQAGVKVTPSVLTVREPNTTASFTVTLDSQPLFPVTISLASADSGECTVPTSVVLNATNWQQGIRVTVTGVNDDFIDGAQSCAITTSATSSDANYNAIAIADPLVTVEDDDYAAVLVSATNPVVTEPNSSTVMVLKLSSRPTAPVTVTLQSAAPDECSTLAQVVLNANNWKSGVGATIAAVDDDIDDDDRTCPIESTVSSSDSNYQALVVNPFAITVRDNDSAGTLVSPRVLRVSEPNHSAIFTVALTSEPTATVTVNLFSNDLSECTAPASVTIAPAQWRTGVGIPVTAVDDAIKDNTRPCLLQATTSSTDAKYAAVAIGDVAVTVDDDDQAGVRVAPTNLTTHEPDGITFFTITLTSEPTATVTVNLVSTDFTECSAPNSVALDANNWARGVAVAVAALNDAIDDDAQACGVQTIVSSVDKNYAGIAAADVAVTVEDDSDTAGIIVSSTDLTVSEPSESATFTVTLTSEPIAPVTINLTSSDSSECSAPTAVVLNATNWANGIAVLVSAVNDDVADGTLPCTLQTSATSSDSGYNGMALADVEVAVRDEDLAGIALDRTALTLTEPSGVAFFTITLNSEPTAPVIVDLVSSDASECTLPAAVTLDKLTWRAGVAVALTVVNDDVMDGSQACTVQTTVNSADLNYHNQGLADVTATVLDDDVAGITLSTTTLTVDELAGTASFTVALTSEPIADVTINLSSSDAGECAVVPTVTLTAQNWRQGVPTTVTAVDDYQADGDQPCQVETRATSTDSVYADFPVADITATVRDDDRIAVFISSTTSVIQEPAAELPLTIRLGSEPVAPVLVSFSVNDTSECLVPATVVLDGNNWRAGITATLKAVDDQIDDGPQSCQLTAQTTSTDRDYDNIPMQPVTVTVADNDIPALVFAAWADRAKVEVGEMITYTYRIMNTGDVTLTTQLADSRLGALLAQPTPLAPGAVVTQVTQYIVNEVDLPGPLQHSATVTAQSPMGAVVTETQALTVALSALPQLEVDVLRLGPPHVIPGTVVTYQITITNVGHIAAQILNLQGAAQLANAISAQVQTTCAAPLTIAAGQEHRCILLWTATKADNDAVAYVVTVEAMGLLNFKATVSDSAIVIVSGPTGVDRKKVYLPLVGR